MNQQPLNHSELSRYSRQILLPEFGVQGQERLKASRVLVIGAGGLGSPVLLYLAAAGVGTIGILDFDKVDESNLQRQIIFTTQEVGKPKAITAAEKVKQLNPNVSVKIFDTYLSSANALSLLADFDLIIDGTDNLPTRYLSNDACVLLNKPLIYGAIFRFEGQVSVFNELMKDGTRGPNYRDLFPVPPPPDMVPSCNEGGVLGVLPGIIGSMMANEAIKILAGMGSTLSGRLMLFDALDFTSSYLKISVRPDRYVVNRLIDYEAFCNPAQGKETVTEMEPHTALEKINLQELEVIDVREPAEFAVSNIGGKNIPLGTLDQNLHLISKDKPLLLLCRSGQRSYKAALKLKQLGYNQVINLKGGLLMWRAIVAPDLTVA
jgi:molybdopterin/thiamine biosynthesis adenylyltransferase/rhodanese-related sulfurtransferase